MIDYLNIPSDVQYVLMWRSSNVPVGLETYKIIQEIIKKNPKYFPWETKYNSIPKEVHTAFDEEAYPDKIDWYKKYKDLPLNNGKGVLETIREMDDYEVRPLSIGGLMDFFDEQNRIAEESRINELKEENRVRKIWNKHYKKYKLEFRK